MAAELKARALVVTVSDRSSAGRMEDRSGPALMEALAQAGFELGPKQVVPDDRQRIVEVLRAAVAQGYDLVVTTGGTGLGPRDVTPQAAASLLDYEVPGLAEEMRRRGAQKTPNALLSRSLAGVSEHTLLLSLPGSRSGALESLEAVLPVLGHALQLLRGQTEHP
ncbi:MAG TPA: MogA/MoaB family molybdenum cofactor biosynthesis protein [Candidatus Acidoferrales bacterium]|nr:MogA/MoaB family molybdenum cofactor biosynthesis protein [Candidatus Acidoferrales bacterium]